jgi:antitoxin (DNA-binding transcriptional repressor) of toxin-antitoxin stability system
MNTVGSYEAKTHLPELLERVARGEKILIPRRRVPVALLTQPPEKSTGDIERAIQQMKRLRKGHNLGKGLTIRDLINEGRRF